MPPRLNYDKVSEFIKSKGDQLLSPTYKNNKTLMKMKCGKCEQEYEQTYSRFSSGHQHQKCPASTNKKKIIKNCKVCNKAFVIFENSKRLTCSSNCKNKINSIYIPVSSNVRARSIHEENIRKYRYAVKSSNICDHCGECNPNLLEFAHYDRSTKKCSLKDYRSIDNLETELNKGRFLCVWCHRLETRRELDIIKDKNMEKWLDDEPDTSSITEDNSSICKGRLCNDRRRLLSSFYIRKGRNMPYSKCKRCIAYESRTKRDISHEFVNDKKIEIGSCLECRVEVTYETTCCFDFDHIDPFYKESAISNMCKNGTDPEIILEEISKCRLLCCKCHRLHTMNQTNSVDYCEYKYDVRINKINIRHNK